MEDLVKGRIVKVHKWDKKDPAERDVRRIKNVNESGI